MNTRIAWSVLTAVALFGATSGSAGAAVVASPETITFLSQTQSAEIALTADGQPLAASDITSVGFQVESHTYEHMISVEKREGSIVVTPTKDLEMGWYDLIIRTAKGTATVHVVAPLGGVKSTVAERAEAAGMTVDEYKVKYGLATTTSTEMVTSIELPALYYEGQTLSVAMPESPGATHIWRVNGEVVQQGPDKNTLHHALSTLGPLVLTYTLEKDGKILSAADASTEVVALPAIAVAATAGAKVTFQGPAGFETYRWQVDGVPAGEEPNLVKTFATPGTVLVECLAKGAASGEFRRVTYKVTVTPRG